jgi:hypothetical protein
VDIGSAGFREGIAIGCSLIGYVPDNEILLDATSERKSNNCAGGENMVFADLRRIASRRGNPRHFVTLCRHLPDFTGSVGPLAIDVNWQLLRRDDGKIYPRRVELQICRSLRRAPVALRWLLS